MVKMEENFTVGKVLDINDYENVSLIGNNITATGDNQLIVGQYNDIDNKNDIFVVAAGDNTVGMIEYVGKLYYYARAVADPDSVAEGEPWYETGSYTSITFPITPGVEYYRVTPNTNRNGISGPNFSYFVPFLIKRDNLAGYTHWYLAGTDGFDSSHYFDGDIELSYTETEITLTIIDNTNYHHNFCIEYLSKRSSAETSVTYSIKAIGKYPRKDALRVTRDGNVIAKIRNTARRDFDNSYGSVILPGSDSTKVGNTIFGQGATEYSWSPAGEVLGSYNFATGSLRDGKITSDFNLFHGDLVGCNISGADSLNYQAFNAVIASRGNIRVSDQYYMGLGRYNLITGFNHDVKSSYSFITGSTNKDYGTYQNIIGGEFNTINSAVDMSSTGHEYISQGSRQNVVFGNHNEIVGSYKLVSGYYNADAADILFAIGNGTSSKRSNAISVHTDGRITAGKNPTDKMDVVTKSYMDSKIGEIESVIDAILNLQNTYLGGE